MLFILYNLLHALIFVVFWPVLLAFVLLKPKYRKRIPQRLGYGLADNFTSDPPKTNVFWVHALSVGEVTSSVPLVAGLRAEFPDSKIVFSASTETGEVVARRLLADYVDQVTCSPIDVLPVITRFLNRLQPDIFILVETDFWPNTLFLLQKRGIPAILVNGRISQQSLEHYRMFSFFFKPIFDSFRCLCMQTGMDVKNMHSLGVDSSKLHNLGNLKIDIPQNLDPKKSEEIQMILPQGKVIFIAGSTHPGEEKLVFQIYQDLLPLFPELFLVLAPRNPRRAADIVEIGSSLNLHGILRTEKNKENSHGIQFLVVDTIGELVAFYHHSTIAFVGGSLVPEGGHNPIEPAVAGVPVLFGPHMQDFSEIAEELIATGGAMSVSNQAELKISLTTLLSDHIRIHQMGKAAKKCIDGQRGKVEAHIRLIRSMPLL